MKLAVHVEPCQTRSLAIDMSICLSIYLTIRDVYTKIDFYGHRRYTHEERSRDMIKGSRQPMRGSVSSAASIFPFEQL